MARGKTRRPKIGRAQNRAAGQRTALPAHHSGPRGKTNAANPRPRSPSRTRFPQLGSPLPLLGRKRTRKGPPRPANRRPRQICRCLARERRRPRTDRPQLRRHPAPTGDLLRSQRTGVARGRAGQYAIGRASSGPKGVTNHAPVPSMLRRRLRSCFVAPTKPADESACRPLVNLDRRADLLDIAGAHHPAIAIRERQPALGPGRGWTMTKLVLQPPAECP